MNTPSTGRASNARATWLCLGLISCAAILLRWPALRWLSGAGISADYTFHPDVNRFVLAASDIHLPNPDGYPQGMTTLLYLTHLALARFTGSALLPLLQAITIVHAGALVAITYATARFWGLNRAQSLLGAAFLAVAPLALAQSNFGTADIAAVTYFYAALLCGGQYLHTRAQLWFVLMCTLTGMCLAMKFFVPLFAPLALVLAG